eukprot:2583057-Prymnesium_polylepis.1
MFVLTFLEEYQKNPQAAMPWASVLLFDELLTSKGVALVRAEVAEDRLTKAEAEHLLLLYQRCARRPSPTAFARTRNPYVRPVWHILKLG